MDITGEQIENYIINELDSKPRHNCMALAEAINHVADETGYEPFALMQLLLENKPIDALHTHSYSFHTAKGRLLIEGMASVYYEEVQFYVD